MQDASATRLARVVVLAGILLGLYFLTASYRNLPLLVYGEVVAGPLTLILCGLGVVAPQGIRRAFVPLGLFLLAIPGILAVWTFLRVPPQLEFMPSFWWMFLVDLAALLVAFGAATFWAASGSHSSRTILGGVLLVAGVLRFVGTSAPLVNGLVQARWLDAVGGLLLSLVGVSLALLGGIALSPSTPRPTNAEVPPAA